MLGYQHYKTLCIYIVVTWVAVILLGAELLALVVGMGPHVLSTSAPHVVGFIHTYIYTCIYIYILLVIVVLWYHCLVSRVEVLLLRYCHIV